MSEPAPKPARKKKVILPRHKIPEQDPHLRAKNFNEVNLGYTPEMAFAEASRCLQCPKPACQQGCPVGVDIPGFIKLIRENDFIEASHHIKETNALPAVCGRVCPQENQCEGSCVLGKSKKYKPVTAKRDFGFAGFSSRLTACSSASSSTTPYRSGSLTA